MLWRTIPKKETDIIYEGRYPIHINEVSYLGAFGRDASKRILEIILH